MTNMNSTPSSNRIHIAIFGRRNAGKSSLINAITGQQAAIVSDTPGLDDEGELGMQRVKRAIAVLGRTDIAIIALDSEKGIGDLEMRVIERAEKMNIPYLLVSTKADLGRAPVEGALSISALTGEGIEALKEKIAHLRPSNISERPILSDLIEPGATIVFVTPCDASAPKGRMILPQQQALRDALDHHCISMVVQDGEVVQALAALKNPPALVVTDSQAFAQVSRDVPDNIPLTSFSILFARHKGFLDAAIAAVDALERLEDGDKILISEGCTHHRQCEDIGTVKIPRMLAGYTGKQLKFEFSSGGTFPENLSGYKLVIHCGGCMLNEREMHSRLERATLQDVPFINYGIILAKMTGVLERSLKPLGL